MADRYPSWLSPTLTVLMIALAYVGLTLARYGGDPLAFVRLGTRFSQGDSQGTEGYDGQFVYYIALDPAGGWRRADVPAYRYQRILYPLLARAMALGQPEAIPWTLIAVNLAALAAGTYATERLLGDYGVSQWYALTYGLYAGQLLALRTDLNEPLSQGLVQWGIYAWQRKKPRLSTLCLGLAVLAKETALVFVVGHLLYLALSGRRRELLAGVLITLLPFAGYQLFLKGWLGAWGLGSGGTGATPFSPAPLGGLLSIGAVSGRALLLFLLIMIPLVVAPAVWCLWAAGRDAIRRDWHPVSLMLLTNSLTLLFLPQSTWREVAAMLRLSIGLVAATVLYGGLKRLPRTLNYSLFWLASLVFLLKE